MRIDLHVHSKYSRRPSQWILKKIGCPECFTEPLDLYRIAMARGMSHVTITDHNTIEGALEIAHLPNTFISEEITTYFPDNGCKLHVLAHNIQPDQHEQIQKLRPNVFDLVAYLNAENIFNVIAHPLYAINDRLTLEHFERLILLFKNFELNGARNQRENRCLKEVLNALSPDDIQRLSEKHRFAPPFSRPWQKHLLAGSDDHSSLNIARAFTEIEGIDAPDGLRQRTEPTRLGVTVRPATPMTMAHNLYSIAYQFYHYRLNLGRYAGKDVLMNFLDLSLRSSLTTDPGGIFSKICVFVNRRRTRASGKPVSDSLVELLRRETVKLIQDHPDLLPDDGGDRLHGDPEQKWFFFVNQVSNRVLPHFADHLMDHLSGANVFSIFHTIGSAGGLYTLLAPYFVAYAQFTKDRVFTHRVLRNFARDRLQRTAGGSPTHLGHFTDTFYEVNGVAVTLQQHVRMAMKNHKKLKLITCHPDHDDRQVGIKNFKPIGVYELPEYPELKIFYPPILEMLQYCHEQGFNQIHTATPGPIGLAALAVARILKLPISGTYHTAIPQYAQVLTGDETIEGLAWRYILWYYDQLDVIYAPSRSTKDELAARGLQPDKIRVYPRGIDIERFNPAKRNGYFKKHFHGVGGTKLLYVGRVSKEKNLHLLAEAFSRLVAEGEDASLFVVGDGPYLEEMRASVAGLPCHFTGYLDGEELTGIYASSDIFVFPSTTDTFGNVVLEAQASGLPVIVSDRGGPCENMLPGETGRVIAADSADALYSAMAEMCRDRRATAAMGQAARAYVEKRSFETAFMESWKMYRNTPPQSRYAREAAISFGP